MTDKPPPGAIKPLVRTGKLIDLDEAGRLYDRETGGPHVFMKEQPAKELRRLHRWMWVFLCVFALGVGIMIGFGLSGFGVGVAACFFSFFATLVLVYTMFNISKREDT